MTRIRSEIRGFTRVRSFATPFDTAIMECAQGYMIWTIKRCAKPVLKDSIRQVVVIAV